MRTTSIATGVLLLAPFCSEGRAAEITLQANVTTVGYLQPNLGANFVDLLAPGAYFFFDGVKYDSFTFSDLGGPSAPAASELWFVFNPNAQNPMVVADPSVIGQGSFAVGWSVTAPPSQGFSGASLIGSDFSSGTDSSSGTSIAGQVFGDGQFLATQTLTLGGACGPCYTNLDLDFAPRTRLDLSFQVDVTGDARFTAFAETTRLVPVPEPGTLSLLGCGIAALVTARRRTPKH